MTHGIAAMPADQRDLGVAHLAVLAIDTLQLSRPFDDLQHALDMRLRQLATRRIGRKPSAEPQGARPREGAAFAEREIRGFVARYGNRFSAEDVKSLRKRAGEPDEVPP